MSLATQLDASCRAGVRAVRARSWPMGILFVVGFLVSASGAYAMAVPYRAGFNWGFAGMAAAVLYFGLGTTMWIRGPRLRPRIVPYFERPLADYTPEVAAPFRRGRALYDSIDELERIALERAVRPLSSFGFADDEWGEQVAWHDPAEGLRTAQALAEAAGPDVELTRDLDALATALRAATEKGAAFSLVVRPWRTEHLQSVMSMEQRQGSFW